MVRSARGPDAFLKACPSREVMARLGEKWTMLLIVALEHGPLRFGELRRKLEGISQKVLTQTLQRLETFSLIERTQFNERTIRVEYQLSPRGRALLPLVRALKQWAEDHTVEVVMPRQSHGAVIHDS